MAVMRTTRMPTAHPPHVCPYCDRLATCKKITSMARNFSLKVLKDKDLAEGMIDSVGTAMDNPETLGSLLSFASIMGRRIRCIRIMPRPCSPVG